MHWEYLKVKVVPSQRHSSFSPQSSSPLCRLVLQRVWKKVVEHTKWQKYVQSVPIYADSVHITLNYWKNKIIWMHGNTKKWFHRIHYCTYNIQLFIVLPYLCFVEFLFLAQMNSTHLSIHQWSVLFHPAACRRSEVEAKEEREHNSILVTFQLTAQHYSQVQYLQDHVINMHLSNVQMEGKKQTNSMPGLNVRHMLTMN